MKTKLSLAALLLSASALSHAQAPAGSGAGASSTVGGSQGAPNGPTRLTNVPTTSTGTILKKNLRWKSIIPLDKTYGELTPEQRTYFHSLYVSLKEGDEPPFPEKGLKSAFKSIQKAQDVLQARGEIDLSVTVGPDGVATNVSDYGKVTGPNAYEMTNYAATVFVHTKFKPAVCQGKPCEMQFPFKLSLN